MAVIYVFRHGQTDYNKDMIFTGWADPDINENGVRECLDIAKQLAGEKPTKGYASDQRRAQHTLEIVLGTHKVPLVVDKRLKERSYGELTGKSKQEMMKTHPKEYELWHRSYDVPPPGGESIKDVEERILLFMKDFTKSVKHDDVIYMSVHGNSLRPIRRYFEKISVEEMCTFEHPRAKVYRYEI